jgi:hypothetical protein
MIQLTEFDPIKTKETRVSALAHITYQPTIQNAVPTYRFGNDRWGGSSETFINDNQDKSKGDKEGVKSIEVSRSLNIGVANNVKRSYIYNAHQHSDEVDEIEMVTKTISSFSVLSGDNDIDEGQDGSIDLLSQTKRVSHYKYAV